MKLLSKDLIKEYGFVDNEEKSNLDFEVMSKDQFDVIIKGGLFYYSNFGIDYPLKDLATLKRIYKEAKSLDLKPL